MKKIMSLLPITMDAQINLRCLDDCFGIFDKFLDIVPRCVVFCLSQVAGESCFLSCYENLIATDYDEKHFDSPVMFREDKEAEGHRRGLNCTEPREQDVSHLDSPFEYGWTSVTL